MKVFRRCRSSGQTSGSGTIDHTENFPTRQDKLLIFYSRHRRTIVFLRVSADLAVLLSSSNKHRGVSGDLAQGYAFRVATSKPMQHQH
jgi:hypothetical protein